MRLVSATIGQLVAYEAGKPLEARELGITDAIKLASNESPLGPSLKALAAMQQAMAELHRYSDAGTYRLRELLAAKLGVGMNELGPGNGSARKTNTFSWHWSRHSRRFRHREID